MVATDESGQDWVHFHIFADAEGQKAVEMAKRAEKTGINTAHWRRTDKGEY